MAQEETFFEFAAEAGLTKHMGNVTATDALVELCHIQPGDAVLDVGCGAGVTPCYLAEKYGCRVTGVDILPRMIERARERAAKKGLSGQVDFRQADAQELPFEDNRFDAVISESVTVFPKDKARAVAEYIRVTRSGGYIGLNESTWLKFPPPPEMVAWAMQEVGAQADALPLEGWRELLAGAGLVDIVAKPIHIDAREEARGIVQRYGLGFIIRVQWRAFRMYIRNPNYRRFLKGLRKKGLMPNGLTDYFGYGLYVGRV